MNIGKLINIHNIYQEKFNSYENVLIVICILISSNKSLTFAAHTHARTQTHADEDICRRRHTHTHTHTHTYINIYNSTEIQCRILKGSPVIPILGRSNQISRIDTIYLRSILL